MIREQHESVCPEPYLKAIGLNPDNVIYFDIETTGFRASTSQLYMIGWAVKQPAMQGEGSRIPAMSSGRESFAECTGGTWIITQLLAQSSSEERLLLEEFLEVLKRYEVIVEFNGDRFDLPYLREKYARYGIPDPFEKLHTVDLYQQIRPCRSLLGMSRLNQKSVEQFLHITREDPYNGGQLIDVYRSVRSHSSADPDASIRSLFLHNYEDVLGMLEMTPIIAYPLIGSCDKPVSWRLLDAYGNPVSGYSELVSPEDGTGLSSSAQAPRDCLHERNAQTAGFLEVSFCMEVPAPRSVETDMDSFRIDISGNEVCITFPLIRRTLYHFFANYRDYYYLPEEDTALHRSVAEFVDPAHRKKATAQTCYVKKTGIFLPQMEESFQPSFRASHKDKLSWFELTDSFLQDRESLSSWVHSLMQM